MIKKRNNQKGLTLLEYCAGAAILGLVVFVTLRAMGDRLTETNTATGDWTQDQADRLPEQDVINAPAAHAHQ